MHSKVGIHQPLFSIVYILPGYNFLSSSPSTLSAIRNTKLLVLYLTCNLYSLSNMTNSAQKQVIGIPISSAANVVQRRPARLLLDNTATPSYVQTPANKSLAVKQDKLDSMVKRMNKLVRKADKFAHGIREHVKLGTKITETLKGKLSLGAKILQVGGVKKIFRQFFTVRDGERLLKVSQCYLSTTSGPIAGLLFISTEKIAFCSERSIKLSSPEGEIVRIHYKAVIPLKKIKSANQSENVKKPSQKLIELVTVDDFDFWFMGFLNHHKVFKCLQQAISQAWMSSSTSHLN
ncbi:GEM-like protein 7 [Mercurialis annua]|uniref:GEM-like protein 7 n=1 Tax=Mercurialis annua TaxID=3986 RepID=UPI00215DE0D6|nr:GEM-like protein 7 [Mercurialis annua]